VSGDARLDGHMALVGASRMQTDLKRLLEATLSMRHFD
jgi:hypothetical protein